MCQGDEAPGGQAASNILKSMSNIHPPRAEDGYRSYEGVAHNFLHDDTICKQMPVLLERAQARASGGPEDLVLRVDRVEVAAPALKRIGSLWIKIELEGKNNSNNNNNNNNNTSSLAFKFGPQIEMEKTVSQNHFLIDMKPDSESPRVN
jgi:hypothetical protein